MTQKKNGFWRFLFSFLPGAGEMYMGFMKMGMSLMTMFFGIVAVATVLEIGPLMFIALIAWFYSFFHVHNLAGMPDEEFYAVEDEYLFHFSESEAQGRELVRTYRKVIAIMLIVLGVVMTWKGIVRMMYRYLPSGLIGIINDIGYRLPQIVVGIAIIVLGVYMIQGKKRQLDGTEAAQPKDAGIAENFSENAQGKGRSDGK